ISSKGALLAVAGRCFGIVYPACHEERWIVGTARRIDTRLARCQTRFELGNVRSLEASVLQIIRQWLQLHSDGFKLRLSDIKIVREWYVELTHQGRARHRNSTLQAEDFPCDAGQTNTEFQDVLLSNGALSGLQTLLGGGHSLGKIL